jgi:hypothetical protein
LCGPADGFGAHTPPIFSRFQCFGALIRFKCFFGPRTPLLVIIIVMVVNGRNDDINRVSDFVIVWRAGDTQSIVHVM